jgi:hypothetical protein
MMKLALQAAVAALMLMIQPGTARANGDPLLARIPAAANALVVIDVEATLASPLAIRQNWKQAHEDAYSQRPLILPPESRRIVIGAQLDATENFRRNWELAVMSLTQPIPMRAIAKAEGGYVDTISGVEAAWTPSDAYFVQLDASTLGMMYPANRQYVSRWAEAVRRNQESMVSPYLKQASASVGRTAPIVLAIDLTDAATPHKVREALEDSAAIKGNQSKIAELARIIPTVQGITLTVNLDGNGGGTLRIDFGQSTAAFASLAKPLVLEAFDRFDMHLGELEQWTARLEGNSIVLTGPLSESGMRRIFSVLEIPSTKFAAVATSESTEAATASSPGDAQSMAATSQAYFKSVYTLIEDLRKTLDDTRDNHAVWMERYGRKVDALPILNVDEELLAWGASVGETFREMALAERSSNVRSGVRKSQYYGAYQYSYDGYGYGNATSTANIRNTIKREEGARAKQVRFSSWKEMEDATAQIRQAMTQKYRLEF